MTQAVSEESLHAELLKRLERVIRRMLMVRFESAKDLWKVQTELLQLQRDIQSAITISKGRERSPDERASELSDLRELRWRTRRFGDAYAWLLLGLDRQVIGPLGRNDPVAIPPKSVHYEGFLAFVSAMTTEGWGFPLLHDITDCLRIGDVTFIKPGQPPLTVEIKTQFLDETPTTKGKVTRQFTISALTVNPLPPVRGSGDEELEASAASDPGPREPARPLTDRARRQIDRLRVADLLQKATPGQLQEIDGSLSLTTVVNSSNSTTHDEVLRGVARRARRNGYATAVVDGAFLWVGIYHRDGLDEHRSVALIEGLPGDVVKSGILFTDRKERNALRIFTVPEHQQRWVSPAIPYYLLGLPKSTVIDLTTGRMVLFNLVNEGRVYEAVEKAGYVVEPSSRRGQHQDPVVHTRFSLDDGSTWGGEIHSLPWHIHEAAAEFRPLRYIVDFVTTMDQASRQAHQERIAGSIPA